ncbi:MAG: hypothetical protein ACREP9_21900 [Candidatus Dormibacteraceae bacterium]
MLDFGKSSKDQELLTLTEEMLGAYAALGMDVKSIARKLFDDAKVSATQRYGNGIYADDFGDRAIANATFMAPRLAAGLTADDVRAYWNRPMLVGFLELKVREFTDWVTLDMARQQGRDLFTRLIPVNQGPTRPWGCGCPPLLVR